jgi:hypothetical protein
MTSSLAFLIVCAILGLAYCVVTWPLACLAVGLVLLLGWFVNNLPRKRSVEERFVNRRNLLAGAMADVATLEDRRRQAIAWVSEQERLTQIPGLSPELRERLDEQLREARGAVADLDLRLASAREDEATARPKYEASICEVEESARLAAAASDARRRLIIISA